MKKTLLSIALTSVLASTSAFAEDVVVPSIEGLSANVAVTNNYLWRGIEQTGGDAAVSGGIDYEHDSGFYAGTWVSNASWGDTNTEVDAYLGFAGDINETFSYDVGYIYYAYPDSASKNDFSEVYGSLSVIGFTFGVSVLADTEAGGSDGDFGDSIYANIDYSFALESGAEIALHAGSYTGDWLDTDSIDYSASISKNGFTLGVSVLDLDDSENWTDEDEDAKFFVAYAVDFDL